MNRFEAKLFEWLNICIPVFIEEAIFEKATFFWLIIQFYFFPLKTLKRSVMKDLFTRR